MLLRCEADWHGEAPHPEEVIFLSPSSCLDPQNRVTLYNRGARVARTVAVCPDFRDGDIRYAGVYVLYLGMKYYQCKLTRQSKIHVNGELVDCTESQVSWVPADVLSHPGEGKLSLRSKRTGDIWEVEERLPGGD